MRRLRTLTATIAAMAVLALSEDEAAAQSAVSSGRADPARQPPSSTLVLPKSAVLETLVGVAESGNVDAMNLLGVLYTTGTEVPRDTSMALCWFQKAIVALQSGLPEELQIAAFASMGDLERRLGPQRRDEASERASRIVALKTRALQPERKSSSDMQLSSL